MSGYYDVAIVTLMSTITCAGMAGVVSRARIKAGLLPPATVGDPAVERLIRAHLNTIEWMPTYLAGLWIFALYWNPHWASALGSIWIAGRLIYFVGYAADAERRFLGFGIQALSASALVLGALGRVTFLAVATH